MEIDFTDQIKKLKEQEPCKHCTCNPCICGTRNWRTIADQKAGYPPNCNEGYEEKDGKCIMIEGYWKKKTKAEKSYPGKNVERREDGVPKKKMKKRACKPGEYRDKNGKLKKTKGGAHQPTPPTPHKDVSDHNLESNPNFNKDIEVKETVLTSTPETKPLQNPRNINEYYKNLYKKVKGLD